jgi:hypothetical protein
MKGVKVAVYMLVISLAAITIAFALHEYTYLSAMEGLTGIAALGTISLLFLQWHQFRLENREIQAKKHERRPLSRLNQSLDSIQSKIQNSENPVADSSSSIALPVSDRFLQQLELRGNDGTQSEGETAYLLAGESDGQLDELIALDDPTMYRDSTHRSVVFDLGKMLRQVLKVYGQDEGP